MKTLKKIGAILMAAGLASAVLGLPISIAAAALVAGVVLVALG